MLDRLKPKGSDLSDDAQVIRIGAGTARPAGYKTALIEGDTPFQAAAAIDRFFSALRAKPSNDVVLYSAEQGEYAMPAAAWAARSGDAALPVRRNKIPAPIVKALREHERPNVFVLGPESVIDQRVLDQLKKEKLARSVNRIEGPNPVENAIAFARYEKGDFGWGVVVPGYNFTIASTHAGVRRRRRGRPRHARGLRAAGALRRRDDAAAEARGVPAERAARVRGQPRPGRVQPRLDPR